jgi:hypothetical protein
MTPNKKVNLQAPAGRLKLTFDVRRTMGDLARRSPAPRRSAGQRRPQSAEN